MAYTITIEEVQTVKAEANEKLTAMIRSYILRNEISAKVNRSKVEPVQKLIVYKSMLEDWEQGIYTNQEYTNFINSAEYINLVHRINSLS